MRRLAPGKEITRADGRRMLVQRVAEVDGLRVIWWRQIDAVKAAA